MLNISCDTKINCSNGDSSSFHLLSSKFPRETDHQNPGEASPRLSYEANWPKLCKVGTTVVPVVHHPGPAFETKKLVSKLPVVLAADSSQINLSGHFLQSPQGAALPDFMNPP